MTATKTSFISTCISGFQQKQVSRLFNALLEFLALLSGTLKQNKFQKIKEKHEVYHSSIHHTRTIFIAQKYFISFLIKSFKWNVFKLNYSKLFLYKENQLVKESHHILIRQYKYGDKVFKSIQTN